jgi:hypothetical protein
MELRYGERVVWPPHMVHSNHWCPIRRTIVCTADEGQDELNEWRRYPLVDVYDVRVEQVAEPTASIKESSCSVHCGIAKQPRWFDTFFAVDLLQM